MFGLLSSRDKVVPVEERNGETQPEEEQTAGRGEEAAGGEEEEAPADGDEEGEETAEVPPISASTHH